MITPNVNRRGSRDVAVQIPLDSEHMSDFCRRHHIRSLALFGTVLQEDFRPDSDVEVLVEFEDDHTLGWELFDLEDELSGVLGRRIDLNTPRFLSRSFRLREALDWIMCAMKDIILQLNQEDYERLESEATRLGVPPATLLRAYVHAQLDGGETHMERRRQAGLDALDRLVELTADLPAVDAVPVARESREDLEGRLSV